LTADPLQTQALAQLRLQPEFGAIFWVIYLERYLVNDDEGNGEKGKGPVDLHNCEVKLDDEAKVNDVVEHLRDFIVSSII
jgi:hypothetical protein